MRVRGRVAWGGKAVKIAGPMRAFLVERQHFCFRLSNSEHKDDPGTGKDALAPGAGFLEMGIKRENVALSHVLPLTVISGSLQKW